MGDKRRRPIRKTEAVNGCCGGCFEAMRGRKDSQSRDVPSVPVRDRDVSIGDTQEHRTLSDRHWRKCQGNGPPLSEELPKEYGSHPPQQQQRRQDFIFEPPQLQGSLIVRALSDYGDFPDRLLRLCGRYVLRHEEYDGSGVASMGPEYYRIPEGSDGVIFWDEYYRGWWLGEDCETEGAAWVYGEPDHVPEHSWLVKNFVGVFLDEAPILMGAAGSEDGGEWDTLNSVSDPHLCGTIVEGSCASTSPSESRPHGFDGVQMKKLDEEKERLRAQLVDAEASARRHEQRCSHLQSQIKQVQDTMQSAERNENEYEEQRNAHEQQVRDLHEFYAQRMADTASNGLNDEEQLRLAHESWAERHAETQEHHSLRERELEELCNQHAQRTADYERRHAEAERLMRDRDEFRAQQLAEDRYNHEMEIERLHTSYRENELTSEHRPDDSYHAEQMRIAQEHIIGHQQAIETHAAHNRELEDLVLVHSERHEEYERRLEEIHARAQEHQERARLLEERNAGYDSHINSLHDSYGQQLHEVKHQRTNDDTLADATQAEWEQRLQEAQCTADLELQRRADLEELCNMQARRNEELEAEIRAVTEMVRENRQSAAQQREADVIRLARSVPPSVPPRSQKRILSSELLPVKTSAPVLLAPYLPVVGSTLPSVPTSDTVDTPWTQFCAAQIVSLKNASV